MIFEFLISNVRGIFGGIILGACFGILGRGCGTGSGCLRLGLALFSSSTPDYHLISASLCLRCPITIY